MNIQQKHKAAASTTEQEKQAFINRCVALINDTDGMFEDEAEEYRADALTMVAVDISRFWSGEEAAAIFKLIESLALRVKGAGEMDVQQQHKAAVALTNSEMVRAMTDGELSRQWREAKENNEGVMRLALSLEMERRGQLRQQAKIYFFNFRDHCTPRQLDRIASRYDMLGSLAVMAEAELVARCDWSLPA